MLNLISSIFALSILVLIHEFGHFLMAKRIGVRVETFSFGFGPKLFKIKRKTTQYVLSAIPFGAYVEIGGSNPNDKLSGEKWEYLSRSVGERAKIILAGPLLNYILGFLIFSLIFFLGCPTLTPKVGELIDGFPAQEKGISVGDRIVAIDGRQIKSWDEAIEIIHKKLSGSLTLTIKRDDKEFGVSLEPKVKKVKNIFGQEIEMGLIGIMPSDEIIILKYGFLNSFYLGLKRLLNLTFLTYKGIWMIITGGLSVSESLTSPLGILYITNKAANLGFIYLLYIMAIISASLAIFNLLPIPVLDGGHIIFLILEKIKGKSISYKAQEIITQFGLVLLISLGLLAFYKDLLRLQFIDKLIRLWK